MEIRQKIVNPFINKVKNSIFKYFYDEELNEKNQNNNIAGTNYIRHSDGEAVLISSDPSKILYFINYARLYLNVSLDDDYVPVACGYLIIYLVLAVFTVMFAIRYMKRVIYIAFLTLMAPLVALTYPIDKIKDRKSTGI